MLGSEDFSGHHLDLLPKCLYVFVLRRDGSDVDAYDVGIIDDGMCEVELALGVDVFVYSLRCSVSSL